MSAYIDTYINDKVPLNSVGSGKRVLGYRLKLLYQTLIDSSLVGINALQLIVITLIRFKVPIIGLDVVRNKVIRLMKNRKENKIFRKDLFTMRKDS